MGVTSHDIKRIHRSKGNRRPFEENRGKRDSQSVK